MAKQGKTTGNLKMRSGPGMQFEPPIAFLVPDTTLEILGEEGEWWKVRAEGKEGYVGKKYVAVTEATNTGIGAELAAGMQGANAPGKAAPKNTETQSLSHEASIAKDSGQPLGRAAGDKPHKGVNEQ
jgi:hypothetical protein